jgi:hypothetical protein
LKTKISALLAALVMALAMLAVPANATVAEAPVVKAKASAKAWGTMVTHAADDSGYTGSIHIVCNSGKHMYLLVGQTTFLGTNEGCTLSGVDRIVVAYNQTVYCKNYAPPYENTYFYTGTNYVPSNRTYKCYSQRPL